MPRKLVRSAWRSRKPFWGSKKSAFFGTNLSVGYQMDITNPVSKYYPATDVMSFEICINMLLALGHNYIPG